MSAAFYDMLFGAEPDGSFAETRVRLRSGGMGQEFVRVRDHERLAALVEARGAKTDIYVGVAPRVRPEGGRDAVERVHALFVDCDSPDSIAALERFDPPPSMVIGSGTGRHAYWSLWPPVSPDEAEAANRRIAHALGADMGATDAARILRPPNTLNHKGVEPKPVTVEHMAVEVYTVEEVVGALLDPEPERSPRRPVRLPTATADPLLSIPASVYVELLTGQPVGRDGKARCPFHTDRTPSLHAWDDPSKGWACFGCEAPAGRQHLGGDIISFGAQLYGLEARGAGYHEIRRRLACALLGREAAA